MSIYRFPECPECIFFDREPPVCESCDRANKFIPKFDESDSYMFMELREIE